MLGLDHKQIFNCKARSVDCLVRLVSLGKVFDFPFCFIKNTSKGWKTLELTAGNMHKMKVC